MATPIVGEAAMVGRELGQLVLPVFQPMDLAVDEDKVGTSALHLIIEVAAVGVDQRHALLAGRESLSWPRTTGEAQRWARGRSVTRGCRVSRTSAAPPACRRTNPSTASTASFWRGIAIGSCRITIRPRTPDWSPAPIPG